MKTLVFDLISVIVWTLWDIALLGELASGVPFRPWITFHMFGPLEFDILSCRISFQLSDLASLIASVASWQVSVHSWRFWWMVWQRQFQGQILACTCGVIQGLEFLLGFDFLSWVVAEEMRISLKWETRKDKLGSWGTLVIFDSTLFVKQDQSTPFLRHRADFGMTGL